MLMPAFLLSAVALSQPGTYHMQKSKLTIEKLTEEVGGKISMSEFAPR